MKMARLIAAWCAACCFSAANAIAQDAQNYPNKPIRIIVPVPPGGGVDALARLVGEHLRSKWSQPVLIENRGGFGGNIGAEAVFRAEPDGYTLLFTSGAVLVTNKLLYSKLNYDPDLLAPIALVAFNYNALIVTPKIGADSVQKFIALAKAKPESLHYASPGSGSGSHLTAELFKAMGGISMAHIPYKGTAPAMTDLFAGEVAATFGELGSFLPHIRSGKLRILAITGEKRIATLPEVPAMNEILPGFLSKPWTGMVAPPKTPNLIAQKISTAVAEGLKQPETAKRLAERQIEAVGGSPEEMSLFIRQELERWGKIIRAIGVKAD
ncbi:MAG: Bug family tripartite tricarboxylate transporter substrate binding protein [Burkholderiales bacterium]